MLKNRNPNILKKISKDLYYEVSHLIELFVLLTHEERNEIIRHALLESLLIHARNIFYFLYESNPKPDDVVIEDYIPKSNMWNNFKVEELKKAFYKDFRFRVGKEIAHLTYNRLEKTEENKYWNLSFVIGLLEGIEKFIELVPSELLHDDWGKYQILKDKISHKKSSIDLLKYAYSTH